MTTQTRTRLSDVGYILGRHVYRALVAAGSQAFPTTPQRVPTPQDFADAMARMVSGVCVVTARGHDGRPHGLVATSFCSYSVNPPAVLVCLGRDGRARTAIAAASGFGVHVLGDGHEDVARSFALRDSDRFDAVAWTWDDDVPALSRDHVVAYLRCARAAVKRHGDHAIVIGCVERVDTAAGNPLVYHRRRMDWRLLSSDDAWDA